MTTLALDLGTSTGWACRLTTGAIISGQWTLRYGGEPFGRRFLRFKRKVDELHKEFGGLRCLVYEKIRRHLGVEAAHVFGGFESMLHAWSVGYGVPIHHVSVQDAKMAATGKGSAKKFQMVRMAQIQFPDQHVRADEEDRADALWILAAWEGQEKAEALKAF